MNLLAASQIVYKCCQNRLTSLLAKGCMPNSFLPDLTKVQDKLEVKQRRKQYPSSGYILFMIWVQQNTPPWTIARSLSDGASGHAAILGYDGYRTNIDIWKLQKGKAKYLVSRDIKKHIPCAFGHFMEPYAVSIHQCLMGSINAETGLHLHPTLPFMHVSPDSLVYYPQTPPEKRVFHNVFQSKALQITPFGQAEIKCLQHSIFLTKASKEYVPSMNNLFSPEQGQLTVKPEYLIQIINQMDCMNMYWTDHVAHWQARPDDPEGQPRHIEDKHYLLAETSVLIVFANSQAASCISKALLRHIDSLRRDVQPTIRIDRADFPDCVILPVKWVKFVLTIPNDMDRPTLNDAGEYIGTVTPYIKHFERQKPLKVCMKDLVEKNGKCVELNDIPAPPCSLTPQQVRNPVLRNMMEAHPPNTLRLGEAVWKLSVNRPDLSQFVTSESANPEDYLSITELLPYLIDPPTFDSS